MVALITGTAAFVSGAGIVKSCWMLLAGFFLAVGGFSLDFIADRDLDMNGVRKELRRNPIAEGKIPVRSGLFFSISFIIFSFILLMIFAPWGLIAWTLALLIIIGLALHWFETPILRALTLGLLQALYALMGASTSSVSPAIWWIAGMFFFAMFGGRGLTDIRDYPLDANTPVQTLPKKYGIKITAQFTAMCLFIAYEFSLFAYFTKEFNWIYLVMDLVFIIVGLICTGMILRHPTPEMARKLTIVFMVGGGGWISLAMILGSLPI
jgi:4-hydroxybenzoate polyprenyltransferase